MNISYSARLCLALSELRGFGLKSFHTLRCYSPNIDQWSKLSLAELRALLKNTSVAESVAAVLASDALSLSSTVSEWLEGQHCSVVSYFDDEYPECLRQIHLAPALLYVQGNKALLQSRCLAIVGSRKTSPMYKELAEQFGFELARHNWTVVSGLALGIDTAAHMGALAANGQTLAVVATGLDRCYPARNRALQERIVEQGLVISEMPLGSAPLKQNFPRRNRIVAGLSQAVLVVEAGIKSGSLITARYALEQNREVYALPGSPCNQGSAGCNYLIREGACLVSSPKELLIELHQTCDFSEVNSANHKKSKAAARPAEEDTILSLLSDQVLSFDALFALSELSFDLVSELLLKLEVDGVIAQVAGGYQRIS